MRNLRDPRFDGIDRLAGVREAARLEIAGREQDRPGRWSALDRLDRIDAKDQRSIVGRIEVAAGRRMQAADRESADFDRIACRDEARHASELGGPGQRRRLGSVGRSARGGDERLADEPAGFAMPREHLDEARVVVEVGVAREDRVESADAERFDRAQGRRSARAAIPDASAVDKRCRGAAAHDDRGAVADCEERRVDRVAGRSRRHRDREDRSAQGDGTP